MSDSPPQQIGVVAESTAGETRVAATPDSVRQLRASATRSSSRPEAGTASGFTDDAYTEAGAGLGDAWQAGRRPEGQRRPRRRRSRRLRDGATLDRPDRPGAEPRPPRRTRRAADHRAGHGRRAAHLARPVAGRAQLDGQHRRLPRGDRGGARLRPVLHRPGHRRRQGAAGQGAGRRRRRGGARGDRRRRQPRRGRPGHRPAARGRRPGPSLGGEFLAVEVEQEVGARRVRQGDVRGVRPAAPPRSTPSRPPTSTSSSPPRSSPAGRRRG